MLKQHSSSTLNPRPFNDFCRISSFFPRRVARGLLAAALLFFLLSGYSSAEDFSAGFRAGSAIGEITPSPGSPMSGYGDRGTKPSRGIHDRLYCRCLFLEMGELRVALVSADLCAITLELRTAILKKLTDLNLDMVFLAATHTHSGPGGYKKGWAIEKFLMGSYSQSVFDYLVSRMATTIREAQMQPLPARIAHGIGSAPDLSRNRRHEGGPAATDVGFLRVEDLRGDPIALVVNFSAHPTVLGPRNLLYSGDYAGMTACRLEEALAVPVLFFAGLLGDQKPHYPGMEEWSDNLEEQFDQAQKIAVDLSGEVSRLMLSSQPEQVSILRAGERWVRLPAVDMRARCFYYVFTPLLRSMFRNIFHDQTVFQAFRINDVLVAGVPAELTSELGVQIREKIPARMTMIVCLANDTLGYVLSPEDYKTGGYESCMCFYGKNTGAFFSDQALATMHEVW